ncbi:MAG: hypothetical protein PVI07_12280, partial [Anaerolineae bacterium]
ERWSVVSNAQRPSRSDDVTALVEVLSSCATVFFAEARQDPASDGSVIRHQDGRHVHLEQLMGGRRSREDS